MFHNITYLRIFITLFFKSKYCVWALAFNSSIFIKNSKSNYILMLSMKSILLGATLFGLGNVQHALGENTSVPGNATSMVIITPNSVAKGSLASLITPMGITGEKLSYNKTGQVVGLEIPNEGVWALSNSNELTFTAFQGFQSQPTPISIEYVLASGERSEAFPVMFKAKLPSSSFVVSELKSNYFFGNAASISLTEIAAEASTISLVEPMGVEGLELAYNSKGAIVAITVPNEGTWALNEATQNVFFTALDTFKQSPTPIGYILNDAFGNRTEMQAITLLGSSKVLNGGSNAELKGLVKAFGSYSVTLTDNSGYSLVEPMGVEGLVLAYNKSGKLVNIQVPNQGTWALNGNILSFTASPELSDIPTPISVIGQLPSGEASEPTVITLGFEAPSKLNSFKAESLNGTFKKGELVQLTPETNGNTLSLVEPMGVSGLKTTKENGSIIEICVPYQGIWTVSNGNRISFAPYKTLTESPTPVQYTLKNTEGNTSEAAPINLTLEQEIFQAEESNITVSQNKGNFIVRATNELSQLSISSSLGTEVSSKFNSLGNNTYKLSTANLMPQMVFVKGITAEGKLVTKKVIVK
jgi:hypothetical protein